MTGWPEQPHRPSWPPVVAAPHNDLDVSDVLSRLATSACRLTGARYGSVTVFGADGRRALYFLTHGLNEGGVESRPRERVLRTRPAEGGFLAVPIRIGDRTFGGLYLAGKHDGTRFTNNDEDVVGSLAAAAGAVADNARLYELAERRGRWLQASVEISQALTCSTDREASLRLVVQHARAVAGGDLSVLAMRESDGQLMVAAADGVDLGPYPRLRFTGLRDMRDGTLAEVSDLSQCLCDEDGRSVPLLKGTGSAVAAPFRSLTGVEGVLLVTVPAEAEPTEERRWLAGFAAHAALALERGEAELDRALLAVLEDRDRIARDLHDLVIQRLFALGLRLQTTRRLVAGQDVAQRIKDTIDELDATIHDIRAAIFELHHRPGVSSLHADIGSLVHEYVAALGFTPQLRICGPVDCAVPGRFGPEILAVIREALSNVVRHATAGAAQVTVTVTTRRVTVRVSDDGVGIGAPQRASGLRNLRARARKFHGDLTLASNHPRGTVATWSVPLSPHTAPGGDDERQRVGAGSEGDG